MPSKAPLTPCMVGAFGNPDFEITGSSLKVGIWELLILADPWVRTEEVSASDAPPEGSPKK